MKLTKLHKEALVRAIMQDTPPIDKVKRAEAIIAEVVKAMSPEVRKLYKTKPDALRRKSVAYTNQYSNWNDVVVGDVSDEKLKEIVEPYRKQEQERSDMHRKLTAAFEGINTLKQAESTFTEFKKYYPTEVEPTKNLPALANVMADLSKLGWPKK
jgi:O-phosphoseryl-tRNA(Cys) synthetase